mmetsp:Transcript_45791/g.85173  ORF Transcript_45791/g.85173 Transcript_45791/m.85173 type:complete len:339 (-) Transcript_45791:67-1083(-)
MSAGADPTSLAFVGSRPSIARYLLKNAEKLLRVKEGGGEASQQPACLVLAADPAGDRARLFKAALEARISSAKAEATARGVAREVALRLSCRERHLERFRLKLASKRRAARDELAPHSTFAESRSMGCEDAASASVRRYLSCPWRQVRNLEDAFRDFDVDGSTSIDASEFQDLMYALGRELSDEQAARMVSSELDLDGSGAVEFSEFALWWLISVEAEGQGAASSSLSEGSHASTATRLRLKVAYESRRRSRQKQQQKEKRGQKQKQQQQGAAEEQHDGGAAVLAAEIKSQRDKASRSANAARLEGDTAAFAVNTAMASRRALTRTNKGAAERRAGGE